MLCNLGLNVAFFSNFQLFNKLLLNCQSWILFKLTLNKVWKLNLHVLSESINVLIIRKPHVDMSCLTNIVIVIESRVVFDKDMS